MKRRLSKEELVLLNQELLGITRSAIPLTEGVRLLRQRSSGAMKQFLGELEGKLAEGKALSQAMEELKGWVEDYYLAMLRTGEESDSLPFVLRELIKGYQRLLSVERVIITSLRYPLYTFFLLLVILGVIATTLVPQIRAVFGRLGYWELPGLSEFTFRLLETYSQYWWVVAAVVAFLILYYLYYRHVYRTIPFYSLIMNLPVFRTLTYCNFGIIFCRYLGNLLKLGIPLARALRLLRDSVYSGYEKRTLDKLSARVEAGQKLSVALEERALFPPLIEYSIKNAEERGDLDSTLLEMAEYFEDRYENVRLEHLAVLAPLLIIIVGIIIGFFVISLYLPLFTIPKLIR